MKSYGLNELRKKYLEFFESKGHLALPSFSLVPENDKSLLLINAGMALVIRYEGPKGGPGMQEMLYPTSFVKGKGIGKQVAMLTDGRYSGGSSGLAIGHIAPEAANKGPIALIKNGDIINIDIPNRTVNVELSDEELTQRRAELEAGDGYVAHRDRKVSQALKAYAAFARSADKGATRDPELIDKLSGLA